MLAHRVVHILTQEVEGGATEAQSATTLLVFPDWTFKEFILLFNPIVMKSTNLLT